MLSLWPIEVDLRTCLLAAIIVLLSNPVLAAEIVLGRMGSDTVFVWKNSEAHSEAIKLIQANVHQSNPILVMRLLACMVPAGTKAVITDMGFASHTIIVTSGEYSGCRGVIPMEDVRR